MSESKILEQKSCVHIRTHKFWNEVDSNSPTVREWLKSVCKVSTLPAYVGDYMVTQIEEKAQALNINVEIG